MVVVVECCLVIYFPFYFSFFFFLLRNFIFMIPIYDCLSYMEWGAFVFLVCEFLELWDWIGYDTRLVGLGLDE